MVGKDNRPQRVRLSITTRRVRIDPGKKRARYIRRLERVMRECDRVIADPEGHEEIQVKAMAVLVRAIRVCYDLVTDIEVEMLERQVEEIKGLLAQRTRPGQADG